MSAFFVSTFALTLTRERVSPSDGIQTDCLSNICRMSRTQPIQYHRSCKCLCSDLRNSAASASSASRKSFSINVESPAARTSAFAATRFFCTFAAKSARFEQIWLDAVSPHPVCMLSLMRCILKFTKGRTT